MMALRRRGYITEQSEQSGGLGSTVVYGGHTGYQAIQAWEEDVRQFVRWILGSHAKMRIGSKGIQIGLIANQARTTKVGNVVGISHKKIYPIIKSELGKLITRKHVQMEKDGASSLYRWTGKVVAPGNY